MPKGDMEKKPVSSISFDPRTGKINGEDKGDGLVIERKPVYCAHPNPLPADHLYKIWHCNTCGGSWAANRETPRIAIGYTEAGEEGGKT